MTTDQPPRPAKSKQRSMRDDIDSLAMNVARIKGICQGLSERLDWNEFITPEALRESDPNIILSRAYSVVDVARIAAGCGGSSSRDRVLEAMQLLEAAEEIAKPNPWKNQSSEEYAKADAEYNRRREWIELARQFVRESSTKEGVSRSQILSKVYEYCGRTGDANAQNKAYMKWATAAAGEWAEICSWRDYISKHPEKETQSGCTAWRKKWKSRGGGFPADGFLKHFEKPYANGSAAYFLNEESVVNVLAGNGTPEFTPLLKSWLNPKNQRLLHDPTTKEYVAHGDRKNRKTRKNHQK
jgi:hypothetical protein